MNYTLIFFVLVIIIIVIYVRRLSPVLNAQAFRPGQDVIPPGGFDSFPTTSFNDGFYISWTPPLRGTPTSYSVEPIIPADMTVSDSIMSYKGNAAFYEFNFVGESQQKIQFKIRAIVKNSLSPAVIVTNRDFACFPKDSLVSVLIDGKREERFIQDVYVGDFVIGAFGEVNQVLGLQHVFVGSNILVDINKSHFTTDHHPHITPSKSFLVCNDSISVSGKSYQIFNGTENVASTLEGLDKKRLTRMKIGDDLKTLNGHVKITSLELIKMDPQDILFNLKVSGSHTYHVDGFAVTGWPSELDFDYDTWTTKNAPEQPESKDSTEIQESLLSPKRL
jgi:hypothetical protein